MALSTIYTALMFARYNKAQGPFDGSKTYYVKEEGVYVAVKAPVEGDLDKYFERGNWQKLLCIKDYPDMGGTPEQIEATTLCDGKQTFVEGVEQTSEFTYTANYNKEDYKKLLDLKGEVIAFGLWFGRDETTKEPDGHDGKFNYQGTLNVYITGKGVNEVREMTITTTPNTEIEFE